MSKLMTKLRATERAQDTRNLAAPQCLPLVGDGIAAQAVLSPLTGGRNAYLARDKRNRWYEQQIEPTRDELIAARYRDWLATRDLRPGRRCINPPHSSVSPSQISIGVTEMNRYRTILRPAGFGGVPHGVKWDYVEAPSDVNRPDLPRSAYRYGVIETDRPLTKAEMDHFDIATVP